MPRSSGGRFKLAHRYASEHELRGVESLLSYGDLLLFVAFFTYMVVFGRKRLPEQGLYLLGGVGGALTLLLYQLLKWYWATKLCVGVSACSAAASWGLLPVLLPLSVVLLVYFGWRASSTRLFHFIAHNRGE